MTKEDRTGACVQEIAVYETEVLITLRVPSASIEDGLSALALWLNRSCARCPRSRFRELM